MLYPTDVITIKRNMHIGNSHVRALVLPRLNASQHAMPEQTAGNNTCVNCGEENFSQKPKRKDSR